MYNIKITTGNSKTGASFGLVAGLSCPGKTEACKSCYARSGNMGLHQAPNKRYGINYSESLRALKEGKLIEALDRAVIVAGTNTVRIHDSGDFYSPDYVKAWIAVIKKHPSVKFWAYTRSWQIPAINQELSKLAKLKNMALWRSLDSDIYLTGLLAHKSDPWQGVAYMQRSGEEDITNYLAGELPTKQFINFPHHVPGNRIQKEVTIQKVNNCPAITNSRKFDNQIPKCLQCKLCLPGSQL